MRKISGKGESLQRMAERQLQERFDNYMDKMEEMLSRERRYNGNWLVGVLLPDYNTFSSFVIRPEAWHTQKYYERVRELTKKDMSRQRFRLIGYVARAVA